MKKIKTTYHLTPGKQNFPMTPCECLKPLHTQHTALKDMMTFSNQSGSSKTLNTDWRKVWHLYIVYTCTNSEKHRTPKKRGRYSEVFTRESAITEVFHRDNHYLLPLYWVIFRKHENKTSQWDKKSYSMVLENNIAQAVGHQP